MTGSWYDVHEQTGVPGSCSDGSGPGMSAKGDAYFMEERKLPVIRVKNIYKIYQVGTNKVYALNGVDFTMYRGEFCAIVGPSGSGKSTLLNMLAGLEKPTKGEIIIAGKHMERMDENQLVQFRRENVGFIFQSYNLLKTLNAVENVALPLSFLRCTEENPQCEGGRISEVGGAGKADEAYGQRHVRWPAAARRHCREHWSWIPRSSLRMNRPETWILRRPWRC